MQTLTSETLALLLDENVEWDGGCELLNPDLTFLEDISDALESGGTVWSLNGTIHTTCSIRLARALQWGVTPVRLYTVATNGKTTARIDRGVFMLTTPERLVGESEVTYSADGFDRLLWLDRPAGVTYTVAAGTTYRAALLAVFAAAELSAVLIEGSAADDVLPATRVWSLVAESIDPDETDMPVTWLRIVNDLLRAINFRGVYCDEQGRYRCEAYISPASRATEATFDADAFTTPVGEHRVIREDVWGRPNRWVFRQTNRPVGAPAATEGDGLYTYPATGRLDDGRPITWTSVVDYEAATQAKLVALGNRRVASDLAVITRYAVTVAPWPVAGHADVYRYVDSEAGVDRKVQLIEAEVDLFGADTVMTWEAVS